METIKRLLSPEYLAVADPGALGGLWVLYVALGLLFGAGLVWAGRVVLRRGAPATAPYAVTLAWFELWICLAGLATVAGRFAGWPGWSARIWPYSLAGLALLLAAVYRWRETRLAPWPAEQLAILAAREKRPEAGLGVETSAEPAPNPNFPVTRFPTILLPLAAHLAGVGLVLVARYGWPWWSAPLVLAALLSPQAPRLVRGRPPVWAALSPLFGAYAVTLLWLAYLGLDITVVGWQGLAFPNPMFSLFYVDGIVLAMVAWSLLCQLSVTASFLGRRAALGRWVAAGLLLATLVWAGTVYLSKRTHGATASDPYAYAQMGVDLAQRGTFVHRFDLFQQVIPLDIAWAPLQPVGYHIPRNDLGDCPSVWATGASALLALGYLLLGETGLYVTTPIIGLLALAATWALAREVLHGESPAVRHVTAALAVALLATSPEQVDRLLVPMADAAALLFTVLFLLFVLRGQRATAGASPDRRAPGWVWWLLAGASFALAYWVRHTQLVLGVVAVVGILAVGRKGNREEGKKESGNVGGQAAGQPATQFPTPQFPSPFLPLLLLFSLAALLTALPDIVYRWRVFGGLLATETTELPLMGVQHIGLVAVEMVRAALAAGEWGYLFPLALFGAWCLARERRREALVLGLAFAAVLLVHLTYRSLRLRDLISLFALLDLAVAFGAVSLLRRAWRETAGQHAGRRLGAALLPVVVLAWIVLSLGLSRWAMIDNVWKRGWASFGYMRAEHRAAFDELAALTPPEAVIGASLNAGAVALYTGRDPIRPYDSWTHAEWEIFLEAMQARGRPVYLLDDGRLMADFIAREAGRRRLVPIAELGVPIFGAEGREAGWLYRLEEW